MAFSPSFLVLIVSVSIFFLCSLGDNAADPSTRKTYIIHVWSGLKPSVFADVEDWYSSTLHTLSFSSDSLEKSSQWTRGNRRLLHVYRTAFHGFCAVLTPAEAELFRSDLTVLGVLPDQPRQLHTTRSPPSS